MSWPLVLGLNSMIWIVAVHGVQAATNKWTKDNTTKKKWFATQCWTYVDALLNIRSATKMGQLVVVNEQTMYVAKFWIESYFWNLDNKIFLWTLNNGWMGWSTIGTSWITVRLKKERGKFRCLSFLVIFTMWSEWDVNRYTRFWTME